MGNNEYYKLSESLSCLKQDCGSKGGALFCSRYNIVVHGQIEVDPHPQQIGKFKSDVNLMIKYFNLCFMYYVMSIVSLPLYYY